MKEQDYWVIVSESQMQQAGLGNSSEITRLNNGKLKIWWGKGHIASDGRDLTRAEDIQIITDDLASKGITQVKVTTK